GAGNPLPLLPIRPTRITARELPRGVCLPADDRSPSDKAGGVGLLVRLCPRPCLRVQRRRRLGSLRRESRRAGSTGGGVKADSLMPPPEGPSGSHLGVRPLKR